MILKRLLQGGGKPFPIIGLTTQTCNLKYIRIPENLWYYILLLHFGNRVMPVLLPQLVNPQLDLEIYLLVQTTLQEKMKRGFPHLIGWQKIRFRSNFWPITGFEAKVLFTSEQEMFDHVDRFQRNKVWNLQFHISRHKSS